ncbi:transport and Golgi organization protein 6 homolog [Asterias rubens]|uniref:transport and Golgi organization protein 6 homolog n=1 Tax=Asterias rubens TaxID=7604 RepID=UPI0014558D32|nr:transport and Golgi organization protein 6 homolog [Asterias rubens]
MAAPMEFHAAIQVLVSPPSKPPECTTESTAPPCDDATRFDLSLKSTLDKLHQVLASDKRCFNLSIALESVITDWRGRLVECKDIRWLYTEHCMVLLQGLKDSVAVQMVEFKKEQGKTKLEKPGPHTAPLLSPDTFSVGQQKNLMTLLQFIVCLGLVPNLQKGIGIPMEKRSGFGQILIGRESVLNPERLKQVVKVLLECVKQPSIGGLILTRHLGDLLASLLQISHSEKLSQTKDNNTTDQAKDVAEPTQRSENSKDVEFFQNQLKRLLQRAYQPLVIRELLFLQGGPGDERTGTAKTNPKSASQRSQNPKSVSQRSHNPLPRAPQWLKKECGRLLTERLIKPKGIQWVLRGLLDVGGGAAVNASATTDNWRKCDAVSHLITNCPLEDITVDKYYKLVCPQILELLHFKDQLLLKQVLRVARSCIVTMTTRHPQLANPFLIGPLLDPLLATLHERAPASAEDGGSFVLVDEPTLTQCIEDVHHIFIGLPDPSPCLLEMLQPVCHPMFKLLCFAKQGVCNLRSKIEEILLYFFCNSEHQTTLEYLRHISFLLRDSQTESVHRGIAFTPGSEGGAVVMFRQNIRAEEQFADSLMSQELTAATVFDLLQKLKIKGLAGDFFILVLKELTSITSRPSSKDPQDPDPSRIFLNIEENQDTQVTHIQHSLQVLAILSKLCENLGPAVLENTSQMLEFARATLDRAASSLDCQGETCDVFETETLTLALGLVSAILRGDLEKKVTSENRESLMNLLPSLEKISHDHPIEPLQRTATDLRIAIATHGAVWSESMKEATEDLKSKLTMDREKVSKIEDRTKKTAGDNLLSKEDPVTPGEKRNVQIDRNLIYEDGASRPGVESNAESSRIAMNEKRPNSSVSQHSDDEPAVSKNFDEAFQELFDPLLPTRGHALRVLGKLLLARDSKAMQKKDMLLGIFVENLSHEDSYIYLSAIQALSCVADVFPERVIPHLCEEFVGGKKKVKREVETRVKLGEALVRAIRSLGELVPRYANTLLGTLLQGAQDTDAVIRASSLSNMADVCKLLRFSLGPNLHEVLNCLMTILKSDPQVEVRRSCVLVLTLLLRGLGKDALKVLENVMRDIYRGLKLALSIEKDDVIRLHCQLALEEIDTVMRDFMFPKQTLTKKITVLP